MSMNVYITAAREVTAKNKAGKEIKDEQVIKFDALQTPTTDTYAIVAAPNPTEAYIDWCLERAVGTDETYPVYAENDPFGENEPVGFETINFYREHVEEFRKWVDCMEEEGYTIKIEVI